MFPVVPFSAALNSAPDQRKTETKQEGMDRAEESASEEWKAAAEKELRAICERLPEFTADHLSAVLAQKNIRTHNLDALGPMMRRGKRNGWCEPTGRVSIASRAKQHSCSRLIWKSLLFPVNHETF